MRAIPIPSAPGAGQGPRRRRRPRLAVAALLLASALPLPAQELPIPEATVGAGRPRIGLALSGGGARGAAHIGVLKVLEELRVPIDCIAGTSMGAVVGGAYAAGVSPQEMERVIAQTDWADVFVDRPPRAEIATRRKQDDYRNLFAPEYGVRDGSLLLPKGVIAGVTIENFLRRLSAPAGGTSDFDRLPIPYRAVATDIETGEEVVLARGSLMRAMRASMAIPGALTPVAIDGRLLVDGGIADNLPIDVVRRLCADVVIAVDIGTPPLSREQLHSALSIVGQLASMVLVTLSMALFLGGASLGPENFPRLERALTFSFSVAALLCVATTVWPLSFTMLLAIAALCGVGVFSGGAIFSLVGEKYGTSLGPSAAGYAEMGGVLATFVAPALMGALLTMTHSFTVAFWSFVVVEAVVLVALLALLRTAAPAKAAR